MTKKHKELNAEQWKKIAIALAQRVNFAISTLRAPGDGMIMKGKLSAKSLDMQHWKDYMADGMEMIPGVKVDRELMHMTRSQIMRELKRKKAA